MYTTITYLFLFIRVSYFIYLTFRGLNRNYQIIVVVCVTKTTQ